jgi:D-arabinose 1-dehydrogenase-like Zn-dependent alcohol dehydrogenase
VLVKIDTVGVCGTDVHITQGLFPATPPSVLGHEASGIIEDVGKGVKKNRIGDRVALNITSSCGKCEYCLNWTISRCKYSQNSTPFFAEYSIVPQMSAVKIPNELLV